MNYRIKRGDQEFGPYSLAELKQYLAEGRVVPTDLALSEGMDEWAPVRTVIGDIGLAQSTAPPSTGSLSLFGTGDAAELPAVPPPPGLHWALVLLLAVVTCGIFSIIWLFIQANWARKIDPRNKAMLLFIIYIVGAFGAGGLNAFAEGMEMEGLVLLAGLINLAGIVCLIVGYFRIKDAMEATFGGAPLYLQMSGVLTFFFNVFYIQYHLTRISELYKRGVQAG
jgi:hypothetical protein